MRKPVTSDVFLFPFGLGLTQWIQWPAFSILGATDHRTCKKSFSLIRIHFVPVQDRRNPLPD